MKWLEAMPKLAMLVLVGLAACGSGDSASDETPAPVPMQNWRTASGKTPTKAEFGAVVASCQDRAKRSAGSFDSCLTDLGLRRGP